MAEVGEHPSEGLLRELAPQALAVVARRSGDFAAAEDAVQEALLAASLRWPTEGQPDHPLAWLVRVARRRLVDEVRSDAARRQREETAAAREVPGADVADRDDTLALLFLCCHPSLTPASAIALTLRAVGGLTTAEIASAYLVPEATMAQRISRAKARIRSSGVAFAMPAEGERGEAVAAVLRVLYLVFSEGYTSTAGPELQRVELAAEAIRLTRMLRRLLPDDPEVGGLLALMLLTDARRHARTGPAGELVPLGEQDRGLWDSGLIAEGVELLTESLSRGAVGEYQLQAAIAAVHDEAATTEDTDWPQILALYSLLERTSGSPMVSLNRAVAAAMVHGPATGLSILDGLDIPGSPLAGHYRLDAVRGHLHEMAGDTDAAVRDFQVAARRTTSLPEQHYLQTQAARLAHAGKAEAAGRTRAADATPPAPPSKPEAEPGPGTREGAGTDGGSTGS